MAEKKEDRHQYIVFSILMPEGRLRPGRRREGNMIERLAIKGKRLGINRFPTLAGRKEERVVVEIHRSNSKDARGKRVEVIG